MFEKVVQRILSNVLWPSVEDLDADALNLGLGSLLLNDLKLKTNLFATLGIDILELESGSIGEFRIEIPLRALLSGKLSISIHGIHAVARLMGTTKTSQDGSVGEKSDEETLCQLRDNKSERVRARAALISELHST